jgi:Zn-dependent M28 family amino/carboxypeptidase
MKLLAAFIFTMSLSACDFSCAPKEKNLTPPHFNADYSFNQIIQYEKFGPKVPGTPEHQKAGDWIISEMKSLGLMVIEQKTEATNFEGKKIPVRNIIASFRPELKKRVLLSAHWDNRPFADQDKKNKDKPILGVNDGGSGVVVLMGIAKAISEFKDFKSFQTGIDFAFWDAEDWGNPSDANSYCLGSQYWASHPVPENYKAQYGINFDMVGRIGSVFPVENYSLQNAGPIVQKLKVAAKKIGYQDFFPDYRIGPIVDDHYFVAEGRGIPMVDLIYMSPEGRFPPEWHTHDDTSEFISRDVLKAVGQTTIQTIFDSEQD